jgi:hypothetical protein
VKRATPSQESVTKQVARLMETAQRPGRNAATWMMVEANSAITNVVSSTKTAAPVQATHALNHSNAKVASSLRASKVLANVRSLVVVETVGRANAVM